ncbi:DNA mismatch endonuclease Vsr [Sorangium sp. So ce185]|uniref:DNA mismatch endonuclease Vsr n=1 Tax=Sorangium sp. So ce185 TaxID=3133287 RepID=UPI003F5DF958
MATERQNSESQIVGGQSVPKASSPRVRARMQAQARHNTACELRLRRALHRRGLRYRTHVRLLPRREADIVFASARVVVFVDGCFWHGCDLHKRSSNTNSGWWSSKIARNRARDRQTNAALLEAGWTVVRIWEHTDAEQAAAALKKIVARRRDQPRRPFLFVL